MHTHSDGRRPPSRHTPCPVFKVIHLILGGILYLLHPGLTPSAVAQERVRLVTGEYPPYTGYKLPEGGLSTFLVKEIFHAAQLPEPILDWQDGSAASHNQGWQRPRHVSLRLRCPAGGIFSLLRPHPHLPSGVLPDMFPEGIEGRWDNLRLCVPQGWSANLFNETIEMFNLPLRVLPLWKTAYVWSRTTAPIWSRTMCW